MQCASPILEAAESLFWPKPAPQEATPTPNLAVLLSERDADVPTVRKALAAGSRISDCLPGPSGSSGFTALHVAAYRDNEDVVRYLALRGADLRAVDARGRTPLDVALRERHGGVAAILLVRGGRAAAVSWALRLGDLVAILATVAAALLARCVQSSSSDACLAAAHDAVAPWAATLAKALAIAAAFHLGLGVVSRRLGIS